MSLLYALLGSPLACRFPDLYTELGIEEHRFPSTRNLHRALNQQRPDFFLGEFVYGWANNYAGTNVSNLDVTLTTLLAKAPQARTIIVMQPGQAPHIGKLLELFPVHGVLTYPVTEEQMRAVLQAAPPGQPPAQP